MDPDNNIKDIICTINTDIVIQIIPSSVRCGAIGVHVSTDAIAVGLLENNTWEVW